MPSFYYFSFAARARYAESIIYGLRAYLRKNMLNGDKPCLVTTNTFSTRLVLPKVNEGIVLFCHDVAPHFLGNLVVTASIKIINRFEIRCGPRVNIFIAGADARTRVRFDDIAHRRDIVREVLSRSPPAIAFCAAMHGMGFHHSTGEVRYSSLLIERRRADGSRRRASMPRRRLRAGAISIRAAAVRDHSPHGDCDGFASVSRADIYELPRRFALGCHYGPGMLPLFRRCCLSMGVAPSFILFAEASSRLVMLACQWYGDMPTIARFFDAAIFCRCSFLYRRVAILLAIYTL